MPKHLTACIGPTIASLRDRIRRWTRPSTRPILGYILDRFRSPEDLGRENALLRKQLEVACRQIARPRFPRADRVMLVLLARLAPTWHSATLLVRPETILRWHRQGFQLFWRRKSKRTEGQSRISAETITLIEQMTRNNRLWGAERIRGFRPILAFFVIAIGSRQVVHVGVTRSPSNAWVAQQLPRGLGCRPALPDPRQRRQVRYAIRRSRCWDRNQDPAHAPPSAERERVLRAFPAERADRVSRPRDHPQRG
jgi:hypothetical protein